MTVDLTTARMGDEVEFRCGGRATISGPIDRRPGESDFKVVIGNGFPGKLFKRDGRRFFNVDEYPFDIIAIHSRSLTPEERLREIFVMSENLDMSSHAHCIDIIFKIKKLAGGY